MENVITFDKSLNERLQEYNRIFPEKCLSLKQLEIYWSRFLLINVSDNGWKAIWKIPRATCQRLKFPYPILATVSVVNVDYDGMTADAVIVAIREDVSIPQDEDPAACYSMPLIELYPTKDQETEMANVLDALRFFYTHIYMPWDLEEEENDWRNRYFENRLRLYYNLKNGVIPKYVSTYIESLLSEVRWLSTKKRSLESTQGDDQSKICQSNEIKLRLHEIRAVIDIFSDPLMLDTAIQLYFPSDTADSHKQQTTWAISSTTTMDDVITFFESIDLRYPSEEFTLSDSLLTGSPGDVFVLDKSSEYIISNTIVLEEGGSVTGIDPRDKSALVSEVENIMINFMGDALIEDLAIDSKSTQCAVLVSSGRAILRNCTITGGGNDTTIKGIVVLENTKLELIDCELKGFYASVVCKPHSKVIMRNCDISSSTFGIQACDNSVVALNDVRVTNCENNGIVVETEDDVDREVGGIEILKMFSGFSVKNLDVSDGVLLRHKPKLMQIESAVNGDEDMECDS